MCVIAVTGQTYYLNKYTNESQWEKPNGPAERQAQDQVQCSHLLVKHRDSRRPSSWREEKITKSKEEAMDELLGWYLSCQRPCVCFGWHKFGLDRLYLSHCQYLRCPVLFRFSISMCYLVLWFLW